MFLIPLQFIKFVRKYNFMREKSVFLYQTYSNNTMAKKQKKEVKYDEADLINLFNLTRLVGNDQHPLMIEWTTVNDKTLTTIEQGIFDMILADAAQEIEGWNEEELKMKFLSFIVVLGHLRGNKEYKTYYERELYTTIDNHYLYLKADFMIAKGVFNKPSTPYFYFQEYKKSKDPSGDPVPQLIEGFLIAQDKNKNGKPMYGCTVTGKIWDFFIMEDKTYCISQSYDSMKPEQLLQIIAILRKFKEILETRLLD